MVTHIPRHERINAQLWDEGARRWRSLHPFLTLDMPYLTDWTINLAQLTLPGDHPQASALGRVRAGVPLPVRFGVNGVVWTGQITTATLTSEHGQPPTWECKIESDHKHGHRMLGRDSTVSAADLTSTRLRGWLGEVTHSLVAGAAQRTGLPTYVLVEGEGDPIEVEVRTEDTLHDVLQDATVGSRMHLDVRMLLPEDTLPGEGEVSHYAGVVERQWEEAELAAGAWPHAVTHERLVGKAAPATQTYLPPRSWRGTGLVGPDGDVLQAPVEGVCWRPFETTVDTPPDYYTQIPPEGVRVSTVEAIRVGQDERPGWSCHVTHWAAWTPEHPDSGLLAEATEAGVVVRRDGTVMTTPQEVAAYIGGGPMWAWRDGPRWVVADRVDFAIESQRRAPRGAAQRQTPGLLVHLHPERDRRGVVFSSTPGGGLEAWSTSHTGPDAAMIIGGGQVDERVLAAAKAGILPPAAYGAYTPAEAAGVLPGGATVPDAVERVDVEAQPLAAIEGTAVSYSTAGGRVDLAKVGPFFYRERYLSLSSSGAGDPLHEITKTWVEAQGTSTMSLTPGASSSVVFGDDVRRKDDTIIPGWRPGDRVSFVDQWTRISEVIAGYRVTAEHGRLVSAVPVLGRQETGVMAELGRRLRDAERRASKAQLAAPQRLPEAELIAAAAKQAADAMLAEQRDREAALEAERIAREEAAEAERVAREEAREAEEIARWEESTATQTELSAALATVGRTYFGHSRTTRNDASEPFFRHSSTGDAVTFTAKGDWIGHVYWVSQVGQAVEVLESAIPNSAGSRSFTTPGRALLIYHVSPGRMVSLSGSAPSRVVQQSTWPTVGSWTAPAGTRRAMFQLQARFQSLTYLNTVGMRVRIGTRELGVRNYGKLAPLIGASSSTVTLNVPMKDIRAGERVNFQVSTSTDKTMTWAKWSITYETTEAA